MKTVRRIIIRSLAVDLLLIGAFVFLTAKVFSLAAFLVQIIILTLALGLVSCPSRRQNLREFRLVLIPALLPAIAFFLLSLVNIEQHCSYSWPWLYLTTLLSYFLIKRLFDFAIFENPYFKELKFAENLTFRKLGAIGIINGLIISIAELLVLVHYEG